MNSCADGVSTYRSAASNQRLQLTDEDLLTDGLLESRRGKIGPLQHILVGGLADKSTIRERMPRQIAAVLQFVSYFFRRGPESKVLALRRSMPGG